MIETKRVEKWEFDGVDFLPPSRYCIVDAMGDHVFFLTTSRKKAQEQVDNEYGKGKYVVRSLYPEARGKVTAK